MSERTDVELLAAWRGGDARAGEELFERHALSIAYFFRNKVSVGVEDFVQETFLALVEAQQGAAAHSQQQWASEQHPPRQQPQRPQAYSCTQASSSPGSCFSSVIPGCGRPRRRGT